MKTEADIRRIGRLYNKVDRMLYRYYAALFSRKERWIKQKRKQKTKMMRF